MPPYFFAWHLHCIAREAGSDSKHFQAISRPVSEAILGVGLFADSTLTGWASLQSSGRGSSNSSSGSIGGSLVLWYRSSLPVPLPVPGESIII